MSSFDLAVGIDGSIMDKGAKVVYQQLYPKVFKGSESITKEGVKFTVAWDIKAAPMFILAPPDNLSSMVQDHLAQPNSQDYYPVALEEVHTALLSTLQDNLFQMQIDDMTMTVSNDDVEPATDPIKLVIYIQANSAGGKLSLIPLNALATVSNPSDEWFINKVILPEAMKMAKTLLSNIDLPPLQFPGLSMTAPVMFVADNHVIAAANVAPKSVPKAPFSLSWPSTPFFALLSDEAKLQVAKHNTRNLIGKTFSKEGNVDVGIGKLYYTAEAKIASLSLANDKGNSLIFEGEILGNVSAGIEIVFTKVGLHYDLLTAPNPAGVISLSVSHNRKVSAKTSQLDTFIIVLKPTGNPIEWILSAVTDPLLQVITLVFAPLISNAFNDISFDVWDLPQITFKYNGVNLKLIPTKVVISSDQGMMSITGHVDIQT